MAEHEAQPGAGNGHDTQELTQAQIVHNAITALIVIGPNVTPDAIDDAIADAFEASDGSPVVCALIAAQLPGAIIKAGITRKVFEARWRDAVKARDARAPASGGVDGLQGKPLDLPLPEPWPQPVTGSALIEEISSYFTAHAVLPKHAAVMLALWVIHTYCPDFWRYTPRMHVTAATKRAGKTRVLRLLKLIVCKPLSSESITPAAIFRSVSMAHPTLLIDEADNVLRDNPDLLAILNSGYERGDTAIRVVGEDREPREFETFAPVALAGIGNLPGTLQDRSITLVMQRALRSEQPAKITAGTEVTAARLQRQIARWVADYASALSDARPSMGALFNRIEDNWTALYAIAAVAGGDLPARAEAAMTALTPDDDDSTDSLGEQLLHDLGLLFEERAKGHVDPDNLVINSNDIVRYLTKLDARPWAEMAPHDRPLTTTKLARLLWPFKVHSNNIGNKAARSRAYRKGDFGDLFARHKAT